MVEEESVHFPGMYILKQQIPHGKLWSRKVSNYILQIGAWSQVNSVTVWLFSNLCRWTICVMISVIREGFCLAWPFPDLVVSNNTEPTLCLLLQRKFVFSCRPFHICLSYVTIHTSQFLSRQLLSYCPLHHRKVQDRSSLLSQEKVGVLANFGFTECHALSSEVDLHVTDMDLQEPCEQHGR